jgi:hypothetical protein
MSKIQAWEYYTQFFDQEDKDLDKKLNHLGIRGWELVTVTPSLNRKIVDLCCYYFKRPKL